MKFLLITFLLSIITSCGVFKGEEKKASKQPKHHIVAVVDEGFDIENSVFQRENISAYKALCINTAKNPLLNLAPETRFENLKKDYINFMENQSNCVTKPKINDNISAGFANIEGQFNLWNAAITEGKVNAYPHTQAVQSILNGENGKFSYHGTATAGLIARDNPDTKILLIEPELLQLMLPNDIYLNKGCRTQAEFDLKARLFEDKEVRKIFINPKREDADSAILKLMKKNKVTMINESYGPTSAAEVHDYHKKLGCEKVNLKHWIIAESKLAEDRQHAIEKYYKFKPLHIRAAGNAGKKLNEIGDTLDPCYDGDNYLIVGATDRNDKIASFSNTGRCVEVYTLGANIIVDAPRDFLNISNGTSFSAPLITRWLTLNSKPGEEEDSLRDLALGATNIDSIIELADWNKKFAYKASVAAPVPNKPKPNPKPDPNGQWKEGWNQELINNYVTQCKNQLKADGIDDEKAKAYCPCVFNGFAAKYTHDEASQLSDEQINSDQVVLQCKQKIFGQKK
jgi:hypothetical protein